MADVPSGPVAPGPVAPGPAAPGPAAAYVAFDRFPSTKGAGVHIGQMAAELFDHAGGGLLVALAGPGMPLHQQEGGVRLHRVRADEPNLLDRAEGFSRTVAGLLNRHADTLRICHVRDPWGALPALAVPGRSFPVVYEVNGLPSIELTHTRPGVTAAARERLRELETACLTVADAVVVPSRVLAATVGARGVPAARIHLVPNGADLPVLPLPRPAQAPDRYLVYVGALQAWQGGDVLLRAFARLADLVDVHLVICSSVGRRFGRGLRRLARRLGVDDRVHWQVAVPHAHVAAWLSHAEISVAPLTACERNLDQGCSPLKILESLAAGVPVVASDLPVVRELLGGGDHCGRLVPPDRPDALARALRVLLEYPDSARELGARGRDRVASGLTWADSRARLREVYRSLDAGTGEGSHATAGGR